MTQIAKKTGLGRESLGKALSAQGNPEFSTLVKVINALGLHLQIRSRVRENKESSVRKSKSVVRDRKIPEQGGASSD